MKRLACVLATSALLFGCSGAAQQRDAADDVRAFLHAARTGDTATFEQHVDRAALRTVLAQELRAAMPNTVRAAERRGGLDAYVDGMISPYGLSQAMARGRTRDRTPPEAEVAALLIVVDERRVCLPGATREVCSLTFTRGAGGVWRLTALDLQSGEDRVTR
ncbi:MAG TPA: DUF2939 domain-containing protein [Caulobacteraceae bacterium]